MAGGPRMARIRGYHTSPHEFEKFSIKKAGTTTDEGKLGEALYFTTDPKKPPGKESQRTYDRFEPDQSAGIDVSV